MKYDAAFLERIVEWVAHPIFVKDREFRYVLVNRALCEMTGFAHDALIGKTDYDICTREEADSFRKQDQELFETRRAVEILEESFTASSGRKHVVATTKVPLLDDAGEATHVVGIVHDLTLLKAAEEGLRRANEELELRVAERTHALAAAQHDLMRQERLAVLGQLAGGVAHQIRNPLGAILNASYVLKRHVCAEEHADVQNAIAIIHDEVRHANQIIVGLLDYARVRRPVRGPASLTEIIERVLAADWIGPTIRVERDLPHGDEPLLLIDSNQLQGAITNLVANAVEAMPSGGTLRVELHLHPDRAIVTISDTGPGLSPTVRAHLFEPLRSTKTSGIGLGLVTARHYVEAHQGRLVCMDVDRGARFEIHLPREPKDDFGSVPDV